MADNHVERNCFIDSSTKASLQTELQVTDDEFEYLENLLKVQNKIMNKERGSSRQPSLIIDDFLYQGDLGHAIDTHLLLDLGIRNIINVCDCPLDEKVNQIFTVLWIHNLEDHFRGNIRIHFDETNQFLSKCKENNEKVLVHCQAGISRSSGIILAYLIRSY